MEPKNIGILINVVGSVCINLGNNLQSSGHRKRSLARGAPHALAAHTTNLTNSSSDEASPERELRVSDTGDVELALALPPLFARPAEGFASGGQGGDEVSLKGSHEDEEADEKAPFLEASAETASSASSHSGSGGGSKPSSVAAQLGRWAGGCWEAGRACRRLRRWFTEASSGGGNSGNSSGSAGPRCGCRLRRWGPKACCSPASILAADPTWAAGSAVFFAGTCAVFVSYSFAPQSLLAPLGAAQFVTNVLFARLIHGAPITARAVGATGVILSGLGLVVCFSPHNNSGAGLGGRAAPLGPHRMRELYSYSAYQLYVASVRGLPLLPLLLLLLLRLLRCV
jgi:hypothetical protein